jgi:hypothetical protein
MEKIILQTAGTMEWETVGVFDDIQGLHEWIKENYDITFDEYKNGVMEEEGYEPSLDEWYDANEIKVIYTKQLG